jgi:hypothetical protein
MTIMKSHIKTGSTEYTVKLKVSLCLIKHCHEDMCGSGGIAPPFLTSALDEDEWSAPRPDRFVPRGRSSQYPLDMRLKYKVYKL